VDLNTAKIQFHAESDDKLFGASHFQTYLYVCVYIYINHYMTTRKYTQPCPIENGPFPLWKWPLSCWMLGSGAGTRGTQGSRHPVASFPKNTLVKSSSSGKLKLGYCKFAIFLAVSEPTYFGLCSWYAKRTGHWHWLLRNCACVCV
jgi:hypothetical protein